MNRSTSFPDMRAVSDRLAHTSDGEQVSTADGSATLSGTPDAPTVTLRDGDLSVVLTHAPHVPAYSLTATVAGQTDSAALTLPEGIVFRLNRLLSDHGLKVNKDWRTGTHVLWVAPRRVLAVQNGIDLTAAMTANGWQVGLGALPVSSPQPAVAPITPDDEVGDPIPAPVSPRAAAGDPMTDFDMGPLAERLNSMTSGFSGRVVMPPLTRAAWYAARNAHRAGHFQVIAMVGPSGTAKTHAAQYLTHEEGLRWVKFDASGAVEPGDWFGTVAVANGSTVMLPSDLLAALVVPGERTLIVDEMNRSNVRALNALLPILDGSGTVVVPQTGQSVPINTDVMIVITANIGFQYGGTEPLDEAVRTRVTAWLDSDYLSEADEVALLMERVANQPFTDEDKRAEKQIRTLKAIEYDPARFTKWDADNLVVFANAVRQDSEAQRVPAVSYRAVQSAGFLIAGGLHPKDAMTVAILNGYRAEGGPKSERNRLKPHVSGIRWQQPAPTPPAAAGDPSAVYSAAADAPCQCGHGPGEHGIGTDISADRACRTCRTAYPFDTLRHCAEYNPTLTLDGAGA